MPSQARQVGSAKQLFIDDRFIDASENVVLTVNPPRKSQIVLRGEAPWEVAGVYVTVIDDGGKVKLYYNTHVHGDGMRDSRLCYAESDDGVHFDKPRLGLVAWEGSTDNNIVFPDVLDACPFIDPNAPPEARWKLLYNFGREGQPQVREPDVTGICLATSPDGLRWTPQPGRVLPFITETHKTALWDADRGKYVIYLRVIGSQPGRIRAIGRIETDDITRPWPYDPTPPPEGDKAAFAAHGTIPLVFEADEYDPPDTDFYTSAFIKYPYAADAYFMFPTAYRHTPPPVGVDKNDGPLATQFACSCDGVTWMRPDRRPYVRPGLSSELDRGYNMMAAGLVRRGDDLYQYYVAKGGTHHGPTDDLAPDARAALGKGCFVLLKQRLDGFMSADAAYTGGTLTTPPLIFTGERLELNIDTEATGTATVEILDEGGTPLPGFTADECDVIGGNFIAKVVLWQGRSSVAALADRPVRLRFAMRSTKLYAFQFCGG